MAGAVRQVVGLVHQEDGRGKAVAVQVAQGGAGVKDVVVIGHEGVGAAGQFQLDLERADLSRVWRR